MDANEFLAGIDRVEYRAACEAAFRAAPSTGYLDAPADFSSDIAHTLASRIWASRGDPVEKLDWTFHFHEEMPCYCFPSYISSNLPDFSTDARRHLWSGYRQFLEAGDALARPVAYSLWCDYFEREDRVAEAWIAVTAGPDHEGRLRQVLDAAGPVPYKWKERLFYRLLPEERWHPVIFNCLLQSQGDLYGHYNLARAERLIRRLRLPPGTEGLGLT